MKITLTVEKFEENPKFQEQMDEYNRSRSERTYGGSMNKSEPLKYILTTTLLADLTEAQFETLKKKVLEIW